MRLRIGSRIRQNSGKCPNSGEFGTPTRVLPPNISSMFHFALTAAILYDKIRLNFYYLKTRREKMSANLVTAEIKAYVDALSSKQKVQLVADLIDYVWQKIKPDELNWERFYEELEMIGININESPSVYPPDKIIMGAGGARVERI